jgi:hypothetical protein
MPDNAPVGDQHFLVLRQRPGAAIAQLNRGKPTAKPMC